MLFNTLYTHTHIDDRITIIVHKSPRTLLRFRGKKVVSINSENVYFHFLMNDCILYKGTRVEKLFVFLRKNRITRVAAKIRLI